MLCVRPTNFHKSLAISGKIEVIVPARLVGYLVDDGKSVIFSNGHVILVKCVVLGTVQDLYGLSFFSLHVFFIGLIAFYF